MHSTLQYHRSPTPLKGGGRSSGPERSRMTSQSGQQTRTVLATPFIVPGQRLAGAGPLADHQTMDLRAARSSAESFVT